MTSGGHDDVVSAGYFAVADVVVNSIDEMLSSSFDENNIFILNNKNNDFAGTGSGFF